MLISSNPGQFYNVSSVFWDVYAVDRTIIAAALFMYVVGHELKNRHVLTYCLITSISPSILVIGSIVALLLLQVTAIITFEVLIKINKDDENTDALLLSQLCEQLLLQSVTRLRSFE
ncbi:hypothetical protein DICVIV_01827 [Dictyocaulus viviparus]|uniref:Uncharacterized protein n=1 Tax=Dictyocaulus viviparus TaxID=29172 RepID=A0A0D8YBR7_DICVI|nr:hypothetical protein DICVIV_01827 [Dictyocaulus viviparus]